MVRLVSSGTEATMTAIRLARGFTGRSRIIKFEGCYHGHSDGLLVKAGSGALTFGQPSSSGVPAEIAALTTVLDYNDAAGLEKAFAEYGNEIAAVIVEPVAGNMNLILPKREFLDAMRKLCTKHGAVLILDEVMTGFRVGLQGAHGHYGIKPDLITLGKVMGGGLPAAAFGGRRDIMQCLAPLGAVYQAGTLSGNPVAVAAGLTTLKLVQAPGFYERLTQLAKQMTEGISASCKETRHPVQRPIHRQHVRPVFQRERTDLLCRSDGERQGCVQPFLPCHAGRRCVSRTVCVRGRLRVCSTYGCRHRGDDCSGRQDLRGLEVMGLFSQAEFYTTVNHMKDLPLHGGKEVAFVGRSNAGKSSAINTLANHTRLAYTSKTPGRTQHLNYFSLGQNNYLVDLPGYGYAKVPPDVQAHWEHLLSEYLQTREELCGLVVIMDARHPLTDRDQGMLGWFAPTGKPIHILLTKSDKLSRQESTKTLRDVKEFLAEHFPQCTAQLFSSLKKVGMDEAEAVIASWFAQRTKIQMPDGTTGVTTSQGARRKIAAPHI